MVPLACSTMTFNASLACRKLPRAFTAMTSSQSAVLISSSGLFIVRPALLTRISTLPNRSFARAIVRTAVSSIEASPSSVAISLPATSCTEGFLSVATTHAPRCSSSFTVSRPIPRAAPVTTLPARLQLCGISFTPSSLSQTVRNFEDTVGTQLLVQDNAQRCPHRSGHVPFRTRQSCRA